MGAKRKSREGKPGAPGKARQARSGAPPAKRKQRQDGLRADEAVPAPENDSDVEVGEEDMDFVQDHMGSMDFLQTLDAKSLSARAKKVKQAVPAAPVGKQSDDDESDSDSDAEAAYERAPRHTAEEKKTAQRGAVLPMKTLDGSLVFKDQRGLGPMRVAAPLVAGVTVEDDLAAEEAAAAAAAEEREAAAEADAEEEEEEEEFDEAQRAAAEAAFARERMRLDAIRELQAQEHVEKRRKGLKDQMAVAAGKLMEAPEKHAGELQIMLQLVEDEDPQTARLAMLTTMALIRDIAPGYRIRPIGEAEAESVAVSKDVQRLRDYELALLSGYKRLLQLLLARANAKNGDLATVRIAVKCMTSLLPALRHFNYASDLLQAVVPRMAHADEYISDACCTAVGDVLKSDIQGDVALEAVQLVADLIKNKKCNVSPRVLRTLYVLEFPDVEPPTEDSQGGANQHNKLKKKAKKKRQNTDEVASDMKQADAGPDHLQAAINQSQMLEGLFEVLFRVIKQATAAGVLKGAQGAVNDEHVLARLPLLYPALEGLARYTHFISVDYFSDIMAVFRQLLMLAGIPLRARLRCVLTVSAILRGHGEAITVDRRDFYSQLYHAMATSPVVPLADEDAEAPLEDVHDACAAAAPIPAAKGGHRRGRYGASEATDSSVEGLLVTTLDAMLTQTKHTDIPRLAGFVKRMLASCLGGSAGSAMGLLAVVYRLLLQHSRLKATLDGEGAGWSGLGSYNPDVKDPSEAGALSSVLWELSMLSKHYHPHVAHTARAISHIKPDGGGASTQTAMVFSAAAAPPEVASLYAGLRTGGMRPPIPKPKARGRKRPHGPVPPASSAFVAMCAEHGVRGLDELPAASGGPEAAGKLPPAAEEPGGPSCDGGRDGSSNDDAAANDRANGSIPEGQTSPGDAELEGGFAAWYSQAHRHRSNAALHAEFGVVAARVEAFLRHLQAQRKAGKGGPRHKGRGGVEKGKKKVKAKGGKTAATKG